MCKISVIIPVYNASSYLTKSVASITNQSLLDIEIICVNDGSTDDSLDILNVLASNDSRIKVVTQQNRGSGSARNLGLKYASGKYVHFFDSDDLLVNDALEKMYINAEQNNSDLVTFKYGRVYENYIDKEFQVFNFDNIFINVDFNHFTFTYKDIKEHIFLKAATVCLQLFKKSFLDKYNIRFPKENLHFEDIIVCLFSLLKANRISFIPEVLYYYTLYNNSNSKMKHLRTMDIFKILDYVEDFLINNDLYEELYVEFICYKIWKINYYCFSYDSQEYYECAKKIITQINLEDTDIDDYYLKIQRDFIKSSSLNEFKSMNHEFV